MWYKIRIQLHSFACRYPVFPILFLGEGAVPTTYGGSQARGRIGAITLATQPQQYGIRATSATYIPWLTAMPDPPTHWARPGIEPTWSWILVLFVSTSPQWELPQYYLLKRLSFPHWVVLATLSKSFWLYMWEFLSGLSIVFHLSVSVSEPGLHCLDYYSFEISFEVRWYETSNLVLFQDCFGYSGYLEIPYEF